uniref:Uncharacterized protein n=1 Tax=Siphoviridae sp. ctgn638 TaxID=2827913 RepID=A0A8S5TLB6_9CAUD|nr:MAG TPA: hypothetical protein [Siphoviridae sp. ctgn638]
MEWGIFVMFVSVFTQANITPPLHCREYDVILE